jgi:hypothetical protein
VPIQAERTAIRAKDVSKRSMRDPCTKAKTMAHT